MKLQMILDSITLPESTFSINDAQAELRTGIRFAATATGLSADTIYIGYPDDICTAIERFPPTAGEVFTFFSCGSSKKLDAVARQANANLITTPLEPEPLYDILYDLYQRVLTYYSDLYEAFLNHDSLSELVSFLATTTDGSVFILNSGYKCIEVCNDRDRIFSEETRGIADELVRDGYLPPDQATALQKLTFSSNQLFMKPLRNGTIVEGYLLVLFPEKGRSSLDLYCCTAACPYFEKLLSSESPQGISVANNQFVADLINRGIASEHELSARQRAIGCPTSEFYSCIVVIPHDTSLSVQNYFLYQLAQEFPTCLTATYENTPVLINFSKSRVLDLQRDLPRIDRFLEKHDAYAGISYSNHSLLMFPASFYQATSAVRFGRIMRKDGDERLFKFEDCAFFPMIDVWRNNNLTKYYNGNIGYLCHPAFIALYRYDRAHDDDLCHVFRVYLEDNGNVSQSAKDLFIHRNTMMKKLEQITHITGKDIDDSYFRALMAFSFVIGDYMRDVLHYEFDTLDY